MIIYDKITVAERRLANLCDHCDVVRDTPHEEHDEMCPLYLEWEQWTQEQYQTGEEDRRWREYEQEMWDHDRGDWKC